MNLGNVGSGTILYSSLFLFSPYWRVLEAQVTTVVILVLLCHGPAIAPGARLVLLAKPVVILQLARLSAMLLASVLLLDI